MGIELETRNVESFLECLAEEVSKPTADIEEPRGMRQRRQKCTDFAGDRCILRLFVETLRYVIDVPVERRVLALQELVVMKICVGINCFRLVGARLRMQKEQPTRRTAHDLLR